jgi:AcrR family transcriptional regulator
MFEEHNISLRERKHAHTKIALVRAAQERMKTRRLEAISVKEICEAVPVSEVTFYNYFSQKTDLLLYSVRLIGVEMAWHLRQWEQEKSGLEIIEALFEFTGRKAEEKPLVVSEAISFFVQKRQKPRLNGISVAERLIAFPDLPGIEDIQPRDFEMHQILEPYLADAAEQGQLPKTADIKAVALMLEAVHIGILMKLHIQGAVQIRSLYHTHLRLLWDGLWAQSSDHRVYRQPEFELALN